jgi:hypothetical protein
VRLVCRARLRALKKGSRACARLSPGGLALGVPDLRFGSLLDEDGCPDGLEGRFASAEVAALAASVAVDDESE